MGFISQSLTFTPMEARRLAASQPASPAPTTVTAGASLGFCVIALSSAFSLSCICRTILVRALRIDLLSEILEDHVRSAFRADLSFYREIPGNETAFRIRTLLVAGIENLALILLGSVRQKS